MANLQHYFLAFGCGSVIIGTISALYQTKIKRFLAYASVSQIGLILLGLSTLSLNGFIGALVHLFIYIFTTLVFFFILINTHNLLVGRNAVYLHEVILLRKYNPGISYLLSLVLLAMAAFPPLGTFLSKVLIYISLLECKFDLMVICLLVMNVFSTLYYLRYIQDIFFFNYEGFQRLQINYLFYSVPRLKGVTVMFIFLMIALLLLPSVFPIIFANLLGFTLSCLYPFSSLS